MDDNSIGSSMNEERWKERKNKHCLSEGERGEEEAGGREEVVILILTIFIITHLFRFS